MFFDVFFSQTVSVPGKRPMAQECSVLIDASSLEAAEQVGRAYCEEHRVLFMRVTHPEIMATEAILTHDDGSPVVRQQPTRIGQ